MRGDHFSSSFSSVRAVIFFFYFFFKKPQKRGREREREEKKGLELELGTRKSSRMRHDDRHRRSAVTDGQKTPVGSIITAAVV